MACCANHDRLDKKLHIAAYMGKICGEHAVELEEIKSGVGGPSTFNPVAHPETGEIQSKPDYCCPDCPTLKAKILAEAADSK